MLKHQPEGLVPFEDCGFARYPTHPLAGEAVTVACRTDAADGVPKLWLWVNGAEMPAPNPCRQEGGLWRFELGAFAWGDEVRYRFITQLEESRTYSFETERERRVDAPKRLVKVSDRTYCQIYEGFYALFHVNDALEIVLKQGAPPEGSELLGVQEELPEGLQLILTGNKKGWLLKRFSSSETLASVEDYILRETKNGRIVAIEQRGQLAGDHIWGTGERFHSVNLRNSGSNGEVVEKFTTQGDQTYLPMPFFMSDCGVGCWRDTAAPAAMDFSHQRLRIRQRTVGERLARDVWLFGAPREILRQYLWFSGKPALPPEWAFGVWISANGWNCDAEVDAQLEALRQCDYPADVMVLEAWSDEQTFYRWNDGAHWRDPEDTVRRIRAAGLHLVLWQIPVVKYEPAYSAGEQLRADEREAIEKGYCVRHADGSPYRITERWFHHSLLLDFTNPEAVRWWFGKRKHLLDMGVEGFKTDGGEFLFDHTAVLHNGLTGLEAHNLYPSQYIGAYHDFMRANSVNGVTFSRADYVGAHTRPLHWAGDQQSLWSELRAQLCAGLSAGLSGVLFWGFDIGGFAGELPTTELYLRATALACFSPVMQWHAEPRSGQFYATHEDGFNNDRSPWNLAEKLHDPSVLQIGAQFARLRQSLKPYLYGEAQYCINAGRPLMAHLCIDYPNSVTACNIDDQYMLGRELLVCPIVEEGRSERDVWLPNGRWKHWFTGEEFEGGVSMSFECPLNQIIVFKKVHTNAPLGKD